MGAVKLVATVVWWCGVFFGLVLTIAWYNGLVSVEQDKYACLGGRHWYAQVSRQRLFAIGRLNLFYQPFYYGCDADHRYNPDKYEVVNGELVPRQDLR